MKFPMSILMVIPVFFIADLAYGQLNREKPAILDEVGVNERLGETIPLDLKFATSEGDSVTLAELMDDGKPVLLNPLYYECPTLCGLVLDAVFNVVHDLAWSPGREYTIISYSIDPLETAEHASAKKAEIMKDLDRTGADEGWYFLTGSEESIHALSEAVGFKYKYDERTGEYIHLASIMLLSPEGKITRYLYGLNMREFDLRNALSEAAGGQIGSVVDRIILYCFTYDSASQSYVPLAINIMKIGGLATMLILGIFLTILWRRHSGTSKHQILNFRNE